MKRLASLPVFALVLLVAVQGSPQPARAAVPPVLLGIAPNYAYAGTSEFTLTMWGYDIDPTTVIKWDGAELPTLVLSEIEAIATVDASLVENPGAHTVHLETPGQAASDALPFTVVSGPPAFLSTSGTQPGSIAIESSLHFFVEGHTLHPGLTIEFEGFPLQYRMLSPAWFLTETFVSGPDTGQADFIIDNAGSKSLSFKSIEAQENPPNISFVGPNTVKAGGPTFILSIDTSSAVQGGTVVEINGTELETFHQDGFRLEAYVPSNLIATVGTLPVRLRATNGQFSPPFNLNVTATGATTPPTLQPFQLIVRATGRALSLPMNANFNGANAYVLWDGTPVRTLPRGSFGLELGVPGKLLETAGVKSLVLVNPPPLNTMQTTPTQFVVYDTADADCDQDVDADDLMIVLNLLTGSTTHNINCLGLNPDNDAFSQITLSDAVVTARKAAGLP